MPDCGEYQYQAIAYRGLFDLKDAQILRAEIDSIDQANNRAAVTFLDVCESASWIDTSAVPFFYHCENSTGTIEDLANGYKAFSVGDIVYILANTGIVDVAESQAFIVGHVDQRDTNPCGDDYLAVSVLAGVSGDTVLVRTIVDLISGNVLNLSTFVDREGSPERPASIPFIDTNGWFAYNFSGYTNLIYPFSFTVTKHSETSLLADELYNSYLSGLVPHTVYVNTTYTGGSSVPSPSPCSDLNLGNGTYERTDTYEGEFDDTGAQVKEHFSTVRSEASKAPYNGGCAAFFTNLSYNSEREYTYPTDTTYVSIADTFTSTTLKAQVNRYESESYSVQATGISDTASLSASYEVTSVFDMDFSLFSGGTYTITDTTSWSALCTVQSPPSNFAFGYSPANSSSCSDDAWEVPSMRFVGVSGADLSRFMLFGGTSNEKVISIGPGYVCTVWGGMFYKELKTPTSTAPVNLAAALTGLPWGEDGPLAYVSQAGYRYTTTPVVFATVTAVPELTLYPLYEGGPVNRFSITECISKAQSSKSMAVSRAIADMVAFIQTTITDDTVFSNVNNAYQYLVSNGISIYPVKKYGT